MNPNEVLIDEMLRNTKTAEVIPDIKLFSPHDGLLYDGSIPNLVNALTKAGAKIVSVVTKPEFKGSAELFQQVRELLTHQMQIWKYCVTQEDLDEAAKNDAEITILVQSFINESNLDLKSLVSHCRSLGMVPIVEVYDDKELDKAIEADTKFIAVNSRNLKTGGSNFQGALRLISQIPQDRIAFFFSNIQTREDVEKAYEAGAKAVLVSKSIEQAQDPFDKLQKLNGLS